MDTTGETTSMLSAANIQQLEAEFGPVQIRLRNALLEMAVLHSRLTNNDAKEYLLEGVGRRLRILRACVEHIYSIYPPSRRDVLDDSELVEICINLHAFFVNVFGLLDNLAWVLFHEKPPEPQEPPENTIHQNDVGLYRKKFKTLLSQAFRDYLNSKDIKKWHNHYLKNFRDALAHRMPVYVPQHTLLIDENRILPCPYFKQKSTDGKTMGMHAQLLVDSNTVVELFEKFVEFEFPCEVE